MTAPARADAWAGADTIIDESACPVCLVESCKGCDRPAIDTALGRLVEGADPYVADTPSLEIDADARITLWDDVTVLTRPTPRALVDGMFSRGSLAYVYSPPGTGKTTLATGLGLAVASGRSLLGQAVVSSGPVVALVAEGGGFYGDRIRAWKTHLDLPLDTSVGFYPIFEPCNLLDPAAVDAVVATIAPLSPSLVIVDTLGESMVGGSENDPRDMGSVIASCRTLQQLGAAVVLTHHTGWDESRERGHSKLRGAADTVLSLAEADGVIRLSCVKQRDQTPFARIHLRLKPVPVAGGREACVLVLADDLPQTELTGTQREALDVLRETFPEGTSSTPWLKAMPMGFSERSFYRARAVLVDLGLVRQEKKTYVPTEREEPAGG